MTLVSIKTDNSSEDGAVKAEFSDGSSIILKQEYLSDGFAPAFWESGRDLSPVEEEAFKFAAECYKAEKAALRLIARAEQNSLALTAKLERRGFAAAVVKAVISRLLDRNLLDDARYAELWLRSRLSRKKARSPRWLRISLGKRGIDRNSASIALENTLDPETEYALLSRFVEQTGFPGKKSYSYRKTQLKYEGFSPEALDKYFDIFHEDR